MYKLYYRFDTKPESGRKKGLTILLDGHNDIVADSSVPDDFQVSKNSWKRTQTSILCISGTQGFTAIIDSTNEYPLTTARSFVIRPGHIVR